MKGSECRVPTVQGAEDDVTAARTGVHYTHSCLLVKGSECRVPTVQGAEDDVTAARTGVHHTHSCLPVKGGEAASLQCREQKTTWQQPGQGYTILTAVYL